VRSQSEREVSESAAYCGIRLSRAQISSNDGLAQVERSNARWAARRKSESSENTHKAERLNTAILSFRLRSGDLSRRLSYLRSRNKITVSSIPRSLGRLRYHGCPIRRHRRRRREISNDNERCVLLAHQDHIRYGCLSFLIGYSMAFFQII